MLQGDRAGALIVLLLDYKLKIPAEVPPPPQATAVPT